MGFPDTRPQPGQDLTPAMARAPGVGGPGPVPRRTWGTVFLVMAVVLAAWTTWLTVRLPSHHLVRTWDVAWGGFDVLLTVMFVTTGVALVRRSPWVRACALVTATLLAVDAWFDITTALPGSQFTQAVLQAALIEAPLAGVCLYLAWRSDRALRRGRS